MAIPVNTAVTKTAIVSGFKRGRMAVDIEHGRLTFRILDAGVHHAVIGYAQRWRVIVMTSGYCGMKRSDIGFNTFDDAWRAYERASKPVGKVFYRFH